MRQLRFYTAGSLMTQAIASPIFAGVYAFDQTRDEATDRLWQFRMNFIQGTTQP